jgi:hypothetical protein
MRSQFMMDCKDRRRRMRGGGGGEKEERRRRVIIKTIHIDIFVKF